MRVAPVQSSPHGEEAPQQLSVLAPHSIPIPSPFHSSLPSHVFPMHSSPFLSSQCMAPCCTAPSPIAWLPKATSLLHHLIPMMQLPTAWLILCCTAPSPQLSSPLHDCCTAPSPLCGYCMAPHCSSLSPLHSSLLLHASPLHSFSIQSCCKRDPAHSAALGQPLTPVSTHLPALCVPMCCSAHVPGSHHHHPPQPCHHLFPFSFLLLPSATGIPCPCRLQGLTPAGGCHRQGHHPCGGPGTGGDRVHRMGGTGL